MQISRGFLIIVSLLLLVTGVHALVPDQVTIWTDREWLTAGSNEISNITVQVINTTEPLKPVEGAVVSVWCENSLMGNISSPQVQTIGNSSQVVTFRFQVGNLSGDAIIHVSVKHPEIAETMEVSGIQHIDHAAPLAFALLSFPSSAPVGSIVQIQVQLKDRYGNIVDSRREDSEGRTAESIVFRDSEDGDGWFIDGTNFVNSITRNVSSEGEAMVQYRLATKAGDNIISIKPPSTVSPPQTFITIKGFGVLSAEILADMNPPSGVVYANNMDSISILYTVRDADKNPIRNATIERTTSLGETGTFRTNDQGQVITTYGPKSSVGTVSIIASVQGYPSVMVISTVQFIHTEAVMWELTASPQTLASR
ncbi:MAG: hypothetical protein QHG99_07005, partial [Methanomicrobiales archaeon]|nr:hypothetical protein [Methanomicrobiales archaeon]